MKIKTSLRAGLSDVDLLGPCIETCVESGKPHKSCFSVCLNATAA